MNLPTIDFYIQGYHICLSRNTNGIFIRAQDSEHPSMDFFLDKHLYDIPRTDNETTVKRVLKNAVIAYKHSLDKLNS